MLEFLLSLILCFGGASAGDTNKNSIGSKGDKSVDSKLDPNATRTQCLPNQICTEGVAFGGRQSAQY